MTAEERAYNYASTQKTTKLQVGEIAKHYNNGYDQAMQDFLEKAEMYLKTRVYYNMHPSNFTIAIQEFKNYMKDESEN